MGNSTTDGTSVGTQTHLAPVGGGSRSAVRRSVKVFLGFFAVYLFTWGGHYTSADGAQKIAWAKVMLFGSSAGIKPGPNGVYSKYGIGHSLIAMLPVAAASWIQKHTGIRCEAALYTLIFVTNGALLLAFIAYYLFQFYEPSRVWWTVALIGFATTWWPYTKMDFSEVLVTTILFAGFVLMRFGRPVLGMLLAASTITIRPDSVLLVALLALWWLFEQPTLGVAVKLGLAILPSLLIVAAANYARYHSAFDSGYAGEGFTTPLLLGLTGILFSAGKSIFLFSPPLILGFLGWKQFRERLATRADALLFVAVFTAQLLVYSKWWDWSSDDAWGVRFMIPALVLMCIPAVEVLERRLLVAAVAAAGVSVQVLAVLVGGLDYLLLMSSQQPQRQALFVSGRNRVDLEDIRFNPNYSQIAGNWILLRHLLHVPPHPSPLEFIEKNGTPLYDTLPPRAWSEAARWDFVWAVRGRRTLRESASPKARFSGVGSELFPVTGGAAWIGLRMAIPFAAHAATGYGMRDKCVLIPASSASAIFSARSRCRWHPRTEAGRICARI
jgi:hypothetical protein